MPVGSLGCFILFQHGNGAWCAAPPGFRNLLLDPVGLGETRVEAARELIGHPEFVERARKSDWLVYAEFADFVEVPEPDCAKFAGHRLEPASAEQRRRLFRIV